MSESMLGKTEEELLFMTQTGHKSATTLRGYIRDGVMFLDHPGAKLL